MRIALLYVRIREEERLLIEAFEKAGVTVEPIDLRTVSFDLAEASRWSAFDAVVDRSLSLTASITAVRVLERFGVRVVNPASAIEICSDKLQTSLALEQAGVPQPRVCVATSPEAAIEAIEAIGYPAVIKPTVGSWGRLVARINDRDAAEAVIEHRFALPSPQQHVVYVQEHVDKPGRDLRIFVVGGEAIAGISRESEHWVTNTARGAVARGIEITPDIADISTRAAACTGADIAAVDLFECPRRGLLVNELNHSMEFRNSITTTGVDIPGRVAQHVIEIARSRPGSSATTPVGAPA
ncbi:MAG: lysine biosynthesis protein LysX [Planctomycetota bacterium]